MTGMQEASIERVLAEVDRLAPELLDTVQRAVRIASVEPKYPGQSYDDLVGRESEVARLVAEVHAAGRRRGRRLRVEQGRDNAVGVVRGAGGGRSLDLQRPHRRRAARRPGSWTTRPVLGHQRRRTHPRPRLDDMKAGVLAQAYAAVALKRAGVRLAGDLTLAAVVGEEVGDHECGTTATIKRGYVGRRGGRLRADRAAVAARDRARHAGRAVVLLTVTGKAAHSGFRGETRHPTLYGSELGVNAIDKGFLIYQALNRSSWSGRRRSATRSSRTASSACSRASSTARRTASTRRSSSPSRCRSTTAWSSIPTTTWRRRRPRSSGRSGSSARSTRGCASTVRCSSGSSSGSPTCSIREHEILPALAARTSAPPRARAWRGRAQAARLRRRLRLDLVRGGRHPERDLRAGRPAPRARGRRVRRDRRGRDAPARRSRCSRWTGAARPDPGRHVASRGRSAAGQLTERDADVLPLAALVRDRHLHGLAGPVVGERSAEHVGRRASAGRPAP